MDNTNELSLDEIKKIELEILKDVAAFCDDNGILYYLYAGTLLGAVRHKGFIPWDDDIDIIMPRKDYEKFLLLTENKEIKAHYKVFRGQATDGYHFSFTKVSNTQTVIAIDYDASWEKGIYVDVFPLDNIPKNRILREWQYINTYILKKCLNVKSHEDSNSSLKLAIKIILRKSIFRLVNEKALHKRLYKHMSRYKDRKTAHLSCLCLDFSRMKIPQEIFGKTVKLEFEGELFNAPAGYREWLTIMFGDYMKLPPEEQRVPPHEIKAYWKGE